MPRPPQLSALFRAAPLLVLLAPGCNHGKRAVEACEEVAEAISCGDTDYAVVLQCSSYADAECNIVAYFDCLEDNFECQDGTGTFGGDCGELAVCD